MPGSHQDVLVIDGSHGEGGGQILRTAISLAAITSRPMRIENIRAKRRNPGLAAQHVTAIRAAAEISDSNLLGDVLGSETLEFRPGIRPVAGNYRFDVAEAREGGSAGAAALVLQTVAIPLSFAAGESSVTVRGGTHVPWSPSYDYFSHVWLETLRRLGMNGSVRLGAWGFYPAGEGEITLLLHGNEDGGLRPVRALTAVERSELDLIEGRAVAANLPSHIAQRMADRAEALLRPLDVSIAIKSERVRAASAGAWIFLRASYGETVSGFGAHGRRGKPAEDVAGEAASRLLDHHHQGAALDRHLADQILLPLAFADGPSDFTCAAATRHLDTNAWAIEQFGVASIDIEHEPDGTGRIRVQPGSWTVE